MPGHGVDAEQVRGLDHGGALRGVGEPGALPEIAAVEQERIAGTGVARSRSIRVFRCAKPPMRP